ncbi:unnamed protein product [Caenorhabditis bovis]|uniref:Uncharacterized protein n=1 Tax=Caenorhabditis bovis TaxID=2654633 RepID=A0A8S1FFZ5_9PELO|nr:unnamed protein product [Caenorhabditis bovis]
MKLTAVIFFVIVGFCSSTSIQEDIYYDFEDEPFAYATTSSPMWEMPNSGYLWVGMVVAIAAFVLFALIVAVFVFPRRGKRVEF